MKKKLADGNNDNHFVDLTYKIIQKSFKQYKLMIITDPLKVRKIRFNQLR